MKVFHREIAVLTIVAAYLLFTGKPLSTLQQLTVEAILCWEAGRLFKRRFVSTRFEESFKGFFVSSLIIFP